MKFSSGYVAYSVCGPSRASCITGRYGQRFGFERNPQYQPTDDNMGLPVTEKTLAATLKQVGYHSGIIGKWHLGATKKRHPLNRGFDEFYGHLGGGHTFFADDSTIKNSYTAKNVVAPSTHSFDKAQTEELGRKLERLVACRVNGDAPDVALGRWLESMPARIRAKLTHWCLIDGRAVAAGTPLIQQVADFEAVLLVKGNVPKYVRGVANKVRRICADCCFQF